MEKINIVISNLERKLIYKKNTLANDKTVLKTLGNLISSNQAIDLKVQEADITQLTTILADIKAIAAE